MDSVKKVVRIYESMKNEWAKTPRDLDLCEKYLKEHGGTHTLIKVLSTIIKIFLSNIIKIHIVC